MKSFFSTSGLAQSSARRPWWTIGAWVAGLVLAVVIMGSLGLKTTTEFSFTNNPEAQAGANVLEEAGLIDDNPTDETVVIRSDNGTTVDDPAFQSRVEEITAILRDMEGVVIPDTVMNYYELSANPETANAANGLVNADRTTTLIPLTLVGTLDEAMKHAPGYLEELESHAGDGFEVISVGYVSIGEERLPKRTSPRANPSASPPRW
jgi:uncharacterized membrane protein YdfJ with MMPL/SSD domain